MDYFTKFTNRIAPPKVQPTSAMQLAKFHKCWEYVHNIFITDDKKSTVHVQQTEIPTKLRNMIDLLVDEEARQGDSTAGVCMEYFLKNGVLQYLVNEAEKQDYPFGFRGEAIRMIANMVDLLDDRFLVHNAVHKPTVKLLRFCVLDDRQNELYSEDLVDLMYIICSKIHGFPALLNIFFHDRHWLTTPQRNKTQHPLDKNQLPEYEFLLFTYLLRFVHREGRSGDFARTGLLFLMEMATDQLGEFMLNSDFATIMAAGLGALYSQLPRKLVVKDDLIPTSLLAQDFCLQAESGIEQSSSPEFRFQLDSFLKLLEFCQDVLTRCPNADICHCLLRNVRTIFLENILYPSISECSDTDGSSVAVISYIDLILQTVLQEDLSKVVVGYLMQTEETAQNRFTLYNLIFSRLRSNSEPTVIATLKLLKTLITHHCQYALHLLSVIPQEPKPTLVSHHLREIELYFSLIVAIDSIHAKDTLAYGYEGYLRDMERQMDADSCHQHMQGNRSYVKLPRFKRRTSVKYGQRHEEKMPERTEQPSYVQARHRLHPSDPLMQVLLDLLGHFFTQSTELNLSLTGVMTALALCPYRSLEGWIAFSKSDHSESTEGDVYTALEDPDDDDQSVDFGVERESDRATRPVFFKSYPSFFTLLRTLTQQIDYYRSDIPSFETLLDERRRALVGQDKDDLAVHVQKTNAIRIQPLLPSHFTSQDFILNLDNEDEHTFAPKTGIYLSNDKNTEITLSMLLNNVVILEESIKEIAALMQVRRSLGIDKVAYN